MNRKTIMAGLAVLVSPHLVSAAVNIGQPTIITKAAIATALGAGAQVENFQKFVAAPHTNYGLDVHTLDSSTVDFQQGSGLVNSGLSFATSSGSSLQWAGIGADSNSTEELMFNLIGAQSVGMINFTAPTPAFGIDLIGISSVNTPANYAFTVDVFAVNHVLLDSESVSLDGNVPVFFTFESPVGIASISLIKPSATSQQISTDYLTYGPPSSTVPEPTTIGALVITMVATLCRGSHRRGQM